LRILGLEGVREDAFSVRRPANMPHPITERSDFVTGSKATLIPMFPFIISCKTATVTITPEDDVPRAV